MSSAAGERFISLADFAESFLFFWIYYQESCPADEYYSRERHLLERENMRTKRNFGFVWIAIDGGWKHGEHFIKRDGRKWVVTSGAYAGQVFGALGDATCVISYRLRKMKEREEEERAQLEDYAEYLSDKAYRERDGFHHAMDCAYNEMLARGLAE